jgi:hypothetical protein
MEKNIYLTNNKIFNNKCIYILIKITFNATFKVNNLCGNLFSNNNNYLFILI